eukprot:366417-Chlamydomonas_euryale.AAC.19
MSFARYAMLEFLAEFLVSAAHQRASRISVGRTPRSPRMRLIYCIFIRYVDSTRAAQAIWRGS